MSESAQRALQVLIASFDRHLSAVNAARAGDDAAVDEAYESLASAFEAYEEALDLEYAEDLPFTLDDGETDEDDEFEEDDDEDDDKASAFDGVAEEIEVFNLND